MSAYQPVLDPACGGRMFWFDKSDSRVLFGDVRDESWELCDGRRFSSSPTISRSSATNSRTAPEHIGSSSLRRIRNEQG